MAYRLVVGLIACAAAGGCSAETSGGSIFGSDVAPGTAAPVTMPVGADGGTAPAPEPGTGLPPTSDESDVPCTPSEDPNADEDLDGFSVATGDCDDCSAAINPGAFDFPGNGFDEDCSGADATMDETLCDTGLAIDSGDPRDAARAMGLCKFTSEDSVEWGVIDARFVGASGTGTVESPTEQAGMLPTFGAAVPREGGALLALSSGIARAPGQPGYTEECDHFTSTPPPLVIGPWTNGAAPPAGYPKESSSCASSGTGGGLFDPGTQIFNQIALELRIRTPTNASSFSFDSNFYSYEYPDFICSAFNDFFVVLKEPLPENITDGNIVFDSNGDPIGVNNGLLDVCVPGTHGGKTFACTQGTDLLQGTGFGAGEATCAENLLSGPQSGAATGWLNTSAPVAKGRIIKLRFAIWDTADATLDSTVLVDNFVWSVEEPEIVETVPVI